MAHPLGRSQPDLEQGEKIHWISPELLVCHPFQPRQRIDPQELEELAASIEKQGILQPLVARSVEGRYEIIAGQRRWQAARRLGLKEVPVILREATDRELLEFALVENLQRSDLNPIEEARAYRLLLEKFGATQEEIADRVGKSRASVANTLRLLALPAELQKLLEEGKLTTGHAKALLSLEDEELQKELAAQILAQGWTVRQAEARVAHLREPLGGKPRVKRPSSKDRSPTHWERKLQESLGRRVEISPLSEGGWIKLYYYSDSDLEELLRLLGVSTEEDVP